MLTKLKKSNNEGFTIIEVMIVLAIAALILLIVLLAVPALQRSSRNTQRKNDISQVSAALANFISNNGGVLPTAAGYAGTDTTNLLLYCRGQVPSTTSIGGTLTAMDSASATLWSYGSNCTSTNTETAKLGLYTLGTATPYAVQWNAVAGPAAGGTSVFSASPNNSSASITVATPNSFIIDLGYGCNASNTNASNVQNIRTASILYATETSGGASLQCVEQ